MDLLAMEPLVWQQEGHRPRSFELHHLRIPWSQNTPVCQQGASGVSKSTGSDTKLAKKKDSGHAQTR